MAYVIEIRNRGWVGDEWQKWGAADDEADARSACRALRAAFGQRYEVRRREVAPAVTSCEHAHGGAK